MTHEQIVDNPPCWAPSTTLRSLVTENAALRADAMRYRWIKRTSYDKPGPFYFIGIGRVSADELDAAIDAALDASKEKVIMDRELLELAAKAAGIVIEWRTLTNPNGGEYMGCWVREDCSEWEPLDDDGDASRLAVKLGLCISHWPRNDPPDVMVGYRLGPENGTNLTECYGTDPDAATRRAIVRAAAEIGKAMS